MYWTPYYIPHNCELFSAQFKLCAVQCRGKKHNYQCDFGVAERQLCVLQTLLVFQPGTKPLSCVMCAKVLGDRIRSKVMGNLSKPDSYALLQNLLINHIHN